MFTFTLFLSLWARILLPLAYPYAPAAMPSGASAAANTPEKNTTSMYIAWSGERRLSWEDFQGEPDTTNPHHALTAANLTVSTSCKKNEFSYTVTCVFLPQQSWSKRKGSEGLLAHEQLHFDLTEVHARQLRQELAQLDCRNRKTRLRRIVDGAFKRWKEEQKRFDQASRHGLDKEEEQVWASGVANRLKKLEAYQ